jgi:regulator of protease activity HflC (stomatin/prohibitin superfamily)
MRAKIFLVGGLVAVIAAIVALKQVFIIVDEREQVIVTQFGEYIRTIQKPGRP